MILIVWVILVAALLLGIGIYQMKTYYSHPHEQQAVVTGYAPYQSGGRGVAGLTANALSSAAGMKHPVVDITLDDGSIKSVRLNIAVNDQIIQQRFPEFDLGGRVSVLYYGDDPEIAYLREHPMAQTVIPTSFPLLIGIALLVLGAVLLIVYVTSPSE